MCETLEPRFSLAGNVAAQLIGGDLYIIGDNAANSIELLGTGRPGEVLIQAAESGTSILGFYPVRIGSDGVPFAVRYDTLERLSLYPTTIDGASGPIVLAGVTGNVYVVMQGGDDFVGVSNLAVPGSLILDTGAGDDSILLGQFPRIEQVGAGGFEFRPTPGSLGVQGSLQINLGDGFDRQFASRAFVRGDVLIQAGDGEDRMQLIASAAANVSAVDPQGVCRFRLDDSAVLGAATIVLPGAASDVDINRSAATGSLSIVTGSASDLIELGDVHVEGPVVLLTGLGDDERAPARVGHCERPYRIGPRWKRSSGGRGFTNLCVERGHRHWQ
jgi:hypothetical protein